MDYALRCNSLKCRAPLTDRAVVTTCSHIFCLPCAESLGLSSATGGNRSCPACGIDLLNPDDAVVSHLNPTEDYKTSILSGLSPTIIMECTARGLAFWNYQATQEIHYQEYLIKSLTEKYNTLSAQMDNVIHDANNELTALRDKVKAEQMEKRAVENQNAELVKAFKDKTKSHNQLHRLYTTLKQQQFAGGIELAAEHDAENVVQAAQQHASQMHSRAGSHGSHGSGGASRQQARPWQPQYSGPRPGLQSAHAVPVGNTPSTHRLYLPGQLGTHGISHGVDHRGTSRRAPLQNLKPNVHGNSALGNASYGNLTNGIKVGRQQSGPLLAENGMGIGRSPRVMGLPGR